MRLNGTSDIQWENIYVGNMEQYSLDTTEMSNVEITVIEKGKEILPSWTTIKTEYGKFNAGFYGLEMPRSESAMDSKIRNDIVQRHSILNFVKCMDLNHEKSLSLI